MYSIYADGVCIYNDVFSLDNMKMLNPKLTLEDSAAGSLEMTLPPTNAAYDTIVRMVTDISVKKNGRVCREIGPGVPRPAHRRPQRAGG